MKIIEDYFALPLYLLFIMIFIFFCSPYFWGPLKKRIPPRFGEPIRPACAYPNQIIKLSTFPKLFFKLV
jgi:hypothetical protein